MGCPICGRIYCDHTPAERGQSFEEMMNDSNTPIKEKDENKQENKQEEKKEEK